MYTSVTTSTIHLKRNTLIENNLKGWLSKCWLQMNQWATKPGYFTGVSTGLHKLSHLHIRTIYEILFLLSCTSLYKEIIIQLFGFVCLFSVKMSLTATGAISSGSISPGAQLKCLNEYGPHWSSRQLTHTHSFMHAKTICLLLLFFILLCFYRHYTVPRGTSWTQKPSCSHIL